ncbi:MAG: hypothetical protein HYZ49_02810 [Chloroflexi bacterium]|nr:hypothetical protein [Chloroflexota bacterium]
MKSPLIPLALAWLGYFTPWLWPVPAALRLSGYDLVEWLTFAQSVRDGTYPITRVDMLWPLIGLALLTALTIGIELLRIEPRRRQERKEKLFSSLCVLRVFAVKNWLQLALALFAAFLILPGYPFILTAHTDPELRPQLIAGLVTGLAVLLATTLAVYRPALAEWLSLSTSLIALTATLRAYALARQPIADIFTKPAPIGYGFMLTIVGFGWLAAQCLTRLWRNGRMPQVD